MYNETKREAKLTLMCLFAIITFWIAAGQIFGSTTLNFHHIPLWTICGTIGVWFLAIFLSFILSRNIK